VTQALADELTQFAEAEDCPHLLPVIARLRRPLRIAVLGRAGVGRRTVEAALGRRGVAVVPGGGAAARPGDDASDARVLVIAEALKAEDLAVLRSAWRPALIALTKADLAGAGPGGPIAVARRRAAAIRDRTGTPTVPIVGLLAAIDGGAPLGEELVGALRSFVERPANLVSVDAFVEDAHPIGREVRARLVERLDRFGIAHAVLALANGTDDGELPAYLQRLGNLDEVLTTLDGATAPARYRRIRAAAAELQALATRLDDDRLATLMATDASVLAAMTAAVDVVEADGAVVDRRDGRVAHLDRAVCWRRYGRGPVNELHRHCSGDIVRGSLRLAGRAAEAT
jgi:hypothetical protein